MSALPKEVQFLVIACAFVCGMVLTGIIIVLMQEVWWPKLRNQFVSLGAIFAPRFRLASIAYLLASAVACGTVYLMYSVVFALVRYAGRDNPVVLIMAIPVALAFLIFLGGLMLISQHILEYDQRPHEREAAWKAAEEAVGPLRLHIVVTRSGPAFYSALLCILWLGYGGLGLLLGATFLYAYVDIQLLFEFARVPTLALLPLLALTGVAAFSREAVDASSVAKDVQASVARLEQTFGCRNLLRVAEALDQSPDLSPQSALDMLVAGRTLSPEEKTDLRHSVETMTRAVKLVLQILGRRIELVPIGLLLLAVL